MKSHALSLVALEHEIYIFYKPVSTNVIAYKRNAEYDSFTATYNKIGEKDVQEILFKNSGACRISLSTEISEQEQGAKLRLILDGLASEYDFNRINAKINIK